MERDKPLMSTGAEGGKEAGREEGEEWAVLSMMGGGRELMDEFRCPICMDMLHKTCLSMVCTHRFCEDCIAEWLGRGRPSCPVCRCRLTDDKLRYDQRITAIMEKVALLRLPGQPPPNE
jgi:SUMO ligase MMS21 Smc5/6 complex component